MLNIPLQPIPNQTMQVQINNQPCTIDIYQLDYGLFVDLHVGATLIIGGVIALNRTLIVRSLYLGFDGDLVFDDTQGNDDPVYTGLGDRFQLLYLDAAEVVVARGG